MKLTITNDNGDNVLAVQTDDTNTANLRKILIETLDALENVQRPVSTDLAHEKIRLKRDANFHGWHFATRAEEIRHDESIRKEIFKSPRMEIFAVLDPEKDFHLQEAQAYTNSRALDIRDKVFALAVKKTTAYFLENKDADVLPQYTLTACSGVQGLQK